MTGDQLDWESDHGSLSTIRPRPLHSSPALVSF